MTLHERNFDRSIIGYMTGGDERPLIDCYDDDSTHVGDIAFHFDASSFPRIPLPRTASSTCGTASRSSATSSGSSARKAALH